MKVYISEEVYKSLQESVTFYDSNVGAHHGQYDQVLYMSVDGEEVGKTEYSIFEGSVYINMIRVYPKFQKKGYGEQMIDWLAKEHDYENIEWGVLTGDGAKLKSKTDLKYNFDPNKTKHLPKEDTIKKIALKSPEAARLLTNLVEHGRDEAYGKFEYDWDKMVLDQNDIYDISTWIQGSKTNDNYPKDEPSEWIIDYLK